MDQLKFNDMIKKYNYYKNIIINDYIDQGVYPNAKLVQDTIKRIDLSLPILKNYNIAAGSSFDTDKYNASIQQIYTDLQYLYELTYELTVSRLNELTTSIESKLLDAQCRANMAYQRALTEVNSTALGEAIIHKTNILPAMNGNVGTINLGNDDFSIGTKIACFIDSDYIDDISDATFIFTNNQSGDKYEISPYNSNKSVFIVPGTVDPIIYYVNLLDNEYLTSDAKLSLSNNGKESTYSPFSTYKVYSGKNKMAVKSKITGITKIVDIPTNASYKVEEPSYIEFYVLNNINLTFTYNKKPISANFDLNNAIVDTNLNKRIFFECDADTAFNATFHNGIIYACHNTSVYNDGEGLIVGNKLKLRDFIIYEKNDSLDYTSYNISVKLQNLNTQYPRINSIIIKKLFEVR